MTTIAWDGQTVAVDSRCTEGDIIVQGRLNKLIKMPDGTLYTFCGSVSCGMELLHAMLNDDDLPTWRDDCTGIRIDPDGTAWVYEGRGPWIKEHGKVAAWGSGRKYALGCLVAGLSAEEAVQTAVKLDPYSAGPIKKAKVL